MVSVSGIIEAALSSILEEGYKNIRAGTNEDRNFQSMIDLAYTNGLISRSTKYKLQGLRRIRNSIHLSSIEYQEHVAYEPDDVNSYLDLLDKFHEELASALG